MTLCYLPWRTKKPQNKVMGLIGVWVTRGGCIGSCWGNRREGDHRWVDIIRMDLQKVGCGYVDWIGLAQDTDRVADACECGNESSGSVKCGEFLDWL